MRGLTPMREGAYLLFYLFFLTNNNFNIIFIIIMELL